MLLDGFRPCYTHGIVPEQIHRNTGEPAWVVPYLVPCDVVLVLHKLIDKDFKVCERGIVIAVTIKDIAKL